MLLKWLQSVNAYTKFDTLLTTNMWRPLLLEIIICLISPYPFLVGVIQTEVVKTFDTEIYYEWNDLMLATMFIRIYIPFRYYFYLTDFINPRT